MPMNVQNTNHLEGKEKGPLPTTHHGYSLEYLDNFNSGENTTPANSPAVEMMFSGPPRVREAFTENRPPRPSTPEPTISSDLTETVKDTVFGPRKSFSLYEKSEHLYSVPTFINISQLEEPKEIPSQPEQTASIKKTKSSKLRSLVSKSRARPKTAHHSRRRIPNTVENMSEEEPTSSKLSEKTQNNSPKVRRARARREHHRNLPMLIPGMVDDNEDSLRSSTTETNLLAGFSLPQGTSSWIVHL